MRLITFLFATLVGLWSATHRVSADEDGATKPLRLRVLSYNIHHGEGNDRKFDLERIAKLIKATEADIAAVQEVDVKTQRAGGVDQAGALAKLTGMHHTFGKAIDFSGGQYGQVILSRWKIEDAKTHVLPGTEGKETRIAIAATIKLHETGPPLRFIGTHLDHTGDPADRLAQCKKLNELFAADDTPTILAGDLNAKPESEEIKIVLEKWQSAAHAPGMKPQPTIPAEKPTALIDYIMLRPAKRWRVVEVKVIDEKVASDHRPVLAVLEWVGN